MRFNVTHAAQPERISFQVRGTADGMTESTNVEAALLTDDLVNPPVHEPDLQKSGGACTCLSFCGTTHLFVLISTGFLERSIQTRLCARWTFSAKIVLGEIGIWF